MNRATLLATDYGEMARGIALTFGLIGLAVVAAAFPIVLFAKKSR